MVANRWSQTSSWKLEPQSQQLVAKAAETSFHEGEVAEVIVLGNTLWNYKNYYFTITNQYTIK